MSSEAAGRRRIVATDHANADERTGGDKVKSQDDGKMRIHSKIENPRNQT
jgi:hypothetical protein